MTDDDKKQEIMAFLHEHVFDPVLESPVASNRLKQGVRSTIMRMNQRDSAGMVLYFWSAISGTERSLPFADDMEREGFTRFEDNQVVEEFRRRFGDAWHRE